MQVFHTEKIMTNDPCLVPGSTVKQKQLLVHQGKILTILCKRIAQDEELRIYYMLGWSQKITYVPYRLVISHTIFLITPLADFITYLINDSSAKFTIILVPIVVFVTTFWCR